MSGHEYDMICGAARFKMQLRHEKIQRDGVSQCCDCRQVCCHDLDATCRHAACPGDHLGMMKEQQQETHAGAPKGREIKQVMQACGARDVSTAPRRDYKDRHHLTVRTHGSASQDVR